MSTNPVLKEGVLAEPVGFLTKILDSYISLELDGNEFNIIHIKQKFKATGIGVDNFKGIELNFRASDVIYLPSTPGGDFITSSRAFFLNSSILLSK